MKKILVLPCKDQEELIKFHLKILSAMGNKPDHVVVIDDHSENQTLTSSEDGWLRVVKGDERGRATTRNRGITEAMAMGADVVVFMDGDSIAEDDLFFSRLDTYFEDPSKPTLVFGTRIHTEKPYDLEKWYNGDNIFYHQHSNKPSDLLTANMDNLQDGKPLDHRDLREVAEVVQGFEEAKDFQEKVDYMLSGMVSWSCNFAITRSAIESVQLFMDKTYSVQGMVFDEVTFRTQWGYEDIAFGLDALFAGVDVHLQDQSRVVHFMHGRSDQLFTHVKGKHLIMQRYRHICNKYGVEFVTKPEGVVSGDIEFNHRTIVIKGRSFERFPKLKGSVLIQDHETIRIGGFLYDFKENTFKKSIWSFILSQLLKVLPR